MRSLKIFKITLVSCWLLFISMFPFLTARAGAIDEAPGIPELLLNVLNFLLQIFGIVAIIALIVSGVIYLTASGDEDRIKLAKRSSLYSVIGIIVALSGMIIIKTISGFLK